MSYDRGRRALDLEPTDHIPHTEYLSHRRFIQKITDIDPEREEGRAKAGPALARALDYDFVWSVYGREWGLPRADMGRAKFYETETPWASHYDLKTEEDVLRFDPVAAADLPSLDALTDDVRRSYEQGQGAYDDAVFPGGFYNSVFTWPIVTFGWELFLTAAMTDPDRFDRVMEGFFEITMLVVEAHIRAEVPVFLCHDDIAWASGPVFSPEWMREHVFPRHERMWKPLREAGIKVLFCSDGNFDVFVDDLARAGAEGFIFEPLTSLERIVEHYGRTHVIIGNADSRILQFKGPAEIRAEVKRCADVGRGCPGYFFAVGNHLPYTVPIESIECYLDACDEFGRR